MLRGATAKFKFVYAWFWGQTAKFNDRQYFRLYGSMKTTCTNSLYFMQLARWILKMENSTAFVRNQTEEDTRAVFASVLVALCTSGEFNFQLVN